MSASDWEKEDDQTEAIWEVVGEDLVVTSPYTTTLKIVEAQVEEGKWMKWSAEIPGVMDGQKWTFAQFTHLFSPQVFAVKLELTEEGVSSGTLVYRNRAKR